MRGLAIAYLIRLLILLGCLCSQVVVAEKDKRVPFPLFEFHQNMPWLNVSRPLSMDELRGKVVILDFWTYGCINCIHVLEDLKKLEQKYRPYLAVIGVHTPKFDREKELKALRQIVVRYDVEHPVLNDVEYLVARHYGMRAWPTQVVIDPRGEPLGKVTGEGNLDILDKAIAGLLEKYQEELSDAPLPLALEKEKFQRSLLAAPGKLAVSKNYVAISDTLHHRIILADRYGKILRIFGGLEPGANDGAAKDARFSSPQGIVIGEEQKIFVADTGNHLIRELNIESGLVKTIAGDGSLNQPRHGRFSALEVGLRSPWALALQERQLYIAMAGSHQIWRLNLSIGELSDYAGSGREGLKDGALPVSQFSQPSGLSIGGHWLYVADAEDSAVRRIHLQDEFVETLTGKGLFDFGDKDGDFADAELQHVLGISAIDDKKVVIADTYNHKLKLLDLQKRTVSTLRHGKAPEIDGGDSMITMSEPGGLAAYKDLILVADTNNNRILQYDLKTNILKEWTLSAANQR